MYVSSSHVCYSKLIIDGAYHIILKKMSIKLLYLWSKLLYLLDIWLQLIVGDFGLSYDQQRVQMGMWSLMASPLLMSVDLRTIKNESRLLLQNPNVIAINQDPLGKQGIRVKKVGMVADVRWHGMPQWQGMPVWYGIPRWHQGFCPFIIIYQLLVLIHLFSATIISGYDANLQAIICLVKIKTHIVKCYYY